MTADRTLSAAAAAVVVAAGSEAVGAGFGASVVGDGSIMKMAANHCDVGDDGGFGSEERDGGVVGGCDDDSLS